MLHIGSNYSYDANNKEILEMLSLLFKKPDLEPFKITNILKSSYDILLTSKEVSKMCTLSQGLIDEGIEIGKLEGIKTGKLEGIELGKSEGIDIGKREQLTHSTSSLMRLGFTKKDIIKMLDITKKDMKLFVSIYDEIQNNNN